LGNRMRFRSPDTRGSLLTICGPGRFRLTGRRFRRTSPDAFISANRSRFTPVREGGNRDTARRKLCGLFHTGAWDVRNGIEFARRILNGEPESIGGFEIFPLLAESVCGPRHVKPPTFREPDLPGSARQRGNARSPNRAFCSPASPSGRA